ncbi:hypothetical protein ACSBR2_035275 [Camellia fascicularis]
MDIRRETLIPEVKDYQIHSSWFPITPVKPIPPKPQPIDADRQENQLGHENWIVAERFSTGFAEETRAHGTVACCDSTNCIDLNKDFDDWEADFAGKSQVTGGEFSICSEFSMDTDRIGNVPFGNLMALADVAATTDSANAASQGNANAENSCFISIFDSHFEGSRFENCSTTSSPANQEILFGSNLWSNSNCALDRPLYGNYVPAQATYDLNLPPGALTDAFTSRNITAKFSPITPDQPKKGENKHDYDIRNLNMDERTNQARDEGNEVAIRVEVDELHHDKEQQRLPKDFSSSAISTQLHENHNPDKEGNPGIDLNRTQQKPRRKKHRPKVVIEGQPKRTRKPVTPKPVGPKENTTGKRKYVRKNGLNKTPGTPTVEVTSESTHPKTAPRVTRSCRRTLNFDLESQVREESSSCRPQSNENAESQAQNFYTRVESKSTVHLGQGIEAMVEKTQVGIAYELNRSMNKVLEDYIAMPERQAPCPPTPAKTDRSHENLKGHAQNEHTRGKCQIVFSNETHDKQGSIVQMMMNTDIQSTPRSPNDSICSSSARLTEGEQARGLKRVHSCTIDEAEPSRTNVIGRHHNSLHEYLARFPANVYNNNRIPGMHFPTIYKKKRTEKAHSSTTSNILSIVTAAENSARRATPWPLNNACATPYTTETNCRFSTAQFNTSRTSTKTTPLTDAQGKQKTFECKLALDQKGRMTKKRSKGPTRVRDLASLIRIVKGKQLPSFPARGAPICGNKQVYEISHHPHTCMEALVADTHATMTTKKRTKRNSTGAKQKRIPTIDAIVDYLKCLDINQESKQLTYQEQGAIVPYNLRFEKKNALILYKRDGRVVPFKGSFGLVRKWRQRPKVDLDEETNRVWKLLLENINSEGIDGTDEEKAKWWEEERRVFRGRANSFIARMHLVQGDRRFSPWKGSVVDSVIGVFLTQNVSDHLSSSAFMSLAAHFPLHSKINDSPCFEETSILVEEPEVCILDPEDSIKWHEEKSNQPAYDRSSMTLHEMYSNVEKVVNGNEFLGSSSSGVKSTDNLKCKSSYISGKSLEIYHKSTTDTVVNQLTEAVAGFMGDRRETDDVLSSQNSVGSSQNSMDSSMAQTTERIRSFLHDNSEANPGTSSNPNSLVGSSFVELLQRAETLCGIYNHKTGNASSYEENRSTYKDGSECDTQKQNKDNLDNKTSSRQIITSNNYCLQMNTDLGLEVESFTMLGEGSLSSDISKKNEENCTSEQSEVTAESVSRTIVQKVMATSFQETPKSPSENNHACSSIHGKVNRIFQSQYRPVGNPNDNIESQTQEQNPRMQHVLEAPNLSIETLDVTQSTTVTNNSKNTEHKAVESSLKDHGYLPSKAINSDTSKVKRVRNGKQKQNTVDWDSLRSQAQAKGKRERTANTMDSLDWEAVRCADVNEIADTIKARGMNNMLAERIKDFLNRLVREHGSIDLEWLRDVPPDEVKEYLLSVRGLGLKSVECVRLLTLHHLAFPVDTNVGRIAVRLGWVPLQPLPESLQLHLLELYPVLESIQRYLWPRLCKLDQRTLYELHYQMITFGKVFCTKSKPNCNACPMRGECRHFASAFASARLALPGPEEKRIVIATENKATNEVIKPLHLPLPLRLPQANQQLQAQSQINNCEPIIEVPGTPEPIVEVPATPEHEQPQIPESDIEDAFCEDLEEIPTIKLNIEELTQNLQNYMQQSMELQEGEMSNALVALTTEAASIPMPKLKNVSRLRTEHHVYELPDSHPLLEGLDKREPDDPCSYLLAIWTPGETANSIQPPERRCSSQEYGKLCDENTCFSCNSFREANSHTVRGTLLIPCRTAMRGSFPLNGTYFQVNEVFADHDSSINPIDVPRAWIWNLPRRTVYFGTSIPTIFKGLSTEIIQYCFWRGFVCVRGFDQKTRAPRPLLARLHFPASKLTRTKGKTDDKQE